ncbi:MAG: sulfatase-like hydrolase/transferase [Candidatus Aegiribacteria sp.]|nr:sulfatase-like hydrolase/transferase [Candidatus Aegiribacteria sp.]MBD3294942.1 sulfatase-like hydrolase/transferase [Candidatus Fermentibacteria bacterium]
MLLSCIIVEHIAGISTGSWFFKGEHSLKYISEAIAIFILLGLLSYSCKDPDQYDALPPDNPRQNILLIIIDTLRADHLSCYGYSRQTSPSLDSLAESGTIWSNAQAQAPWTLPAHATIWTGLSVRSHRTLNPVAAGEENGEVVKLIYELDTDLPSLPVILRDAGFSTFGLANFTILSSIYGFNEGFDTYSCHPTGEGRAAVSVDSLMLWLDDHHRERFFCMLHLYDVHSPYSPPGGFNTAFQDDPDNTFFDWELDGDTILNRDDLQLAVDLYDGEIRWVDENLDRLFRRLRRYDLEDETLVLVMSDHGEEFLEHGWVLHGNTLYQEALHVPLIMSGPGIDAGVVDTTWIGQFDILPTLIAWAGVESDAVFDGTDILDSPDPQRAIPSSGNTPLQWQEQWPIASSVSGGVKTIMMNNMEDFVTYRLNEDPAEMNPLPGDSGGIEDVLYYWASPQIGFPEFAESDPQSIQALKDLGYLDD